MCWLAAALFWLLLCAVVLGIVSIHSIMEARAYNRVTGSNVTWWDAVWLDLRVQEGVKEER